MTKTYKYISQGFLFALLFVSACSFGQTLGTGAVGTPDKNNTTTTTVKDQPKPELNNFSVSKPADQNNQTDPKERKTETPVLNSTGKPKK